MAAELEKAADLSAASGAPPSEEKPSTPGVDLPAPTPDKPKD